MPIRWLRYATARRCWNASTEIDCICSAHSCRPYSELLPNECISYNTPVASNQRRRRIMASILAHRSPRKRPRKIIVGPEDNGRCMSLKDFDKAEVKEGYLYELSRGVITVSDVPDWPHLMQIDAAYQQFSAHRRRHPESIFVMSQGSDCKVLLWDLQSERHPDLSIYTEPSPAGKNVWAEWIAAIVIEVVSKSSEHRDYVEKPEEYLQFGIREYWILDEAKNQMLVLRRSGGAWTEIPVKPPKLYQTPLLPGLKFSCAKVFKAARTGRR
jgi:Uma2 family endonuclease